MPRYRRRYRNCKRKGFTVVELLTVVLIISILLAVALPLYLDALDDSQKKTCRANMQTISNSVMAARVKSMANDFASLISSGVTTTNLPDLASVPHCPNGGAYTLAIGSSGTPTTFQVKCNTTYPLTHGKFEPGVDGN
jgi:type IV pilus assembly protein PilA